MCAPCPVSDQVQFNGHPICPLKNILAHSKGMDLTTNNQHATLVVAVAAAPAPVADGHALLSFSIARTNFRA